MSNFHDLKLFLCHVKQFPNLGWKKSSEQDSIKTQLRKVNKTDDFNDGPHRRLKFQIVTKVVSDSLGLGDYWYRICISIWLILVLFQCIEYS